MAVADGRERARITHDDAVRAVAFSPDGQSLATASGTTTARIVAVADGRERARITHDGEVIAVAFSPDGQSLATASGDTKERRGAARGGGGRPRARPHHPRRHGPRGGVQPGRPVPRHRERGQTARIVAVADGRERARITHDGAV